MQLCRLIGECLVLALDLQQILQGFGPGVSGVALFAQLLNLLLRIVDRIGAGCIGRQLLQLGDGCYCLFRLRQVTARVLETVVSLST